MGGTPILQEVDEGGIHEVVIVGNAENCDSFPLEHMTEFSIETLSMDFLHHDHDVSPCDLILREDSVCIFAKPGRIDFDPVVVRKYFLSRRTTQPVP